MLAAIAQSVATSRLKTIARSPIQIRIRRSTSGQAVRLRNAMASPSQTSAVDTRRWSVLAKSVTAPITIRQSRAHSIEQHHQQFRDAVPTRLGQMGTRAAVPRSSLR